MINDATMMRALRAEIERTLKKTESRKAYGLAQKDFMGSIADYLGSRNGADLEYLEKEFVSLFNKLPASRKVFNPDNSERVAIFDTQADADAFYRKVLRNVRRSDKDPVRRERYRESYIRNADGNSVSSYRALYPQNYDIASSIRELSEEFRHNPVAYGRIAEKSSKVDTGNIELDKSFIDITKRIQQNQQFSTIIRSKLVGGEIKVESSMSARIITNKMDIRSELKKIQTALEDYSRENVVLTTREFLSEAITDILLKGKVPKTLQPKVNRTTASGKNVIEIVKPKAKLTKNRTIRIGNAQANAAAVTSFINRTINSYVRRMMGTEGALVWRTGRFANSVKATRAVLDSRTNALYVYTQYMRFPYATFAKGGQMYTYERDPERLIARSVRALMKESFQADWRLYVRNE